jgi:DNA-binding winged helix-turn-helix (wHTH) protein
LATKEELPQAVWGDTLVEEGNLTQYTSHLRKALGDNSEDTRLIVTIAPKGYQFTARVTVAEPAAIAKPAAVQVPGITENSRVDARPITNMQQRRRFQKRQGVGGALRLWLFRLSFWRPPLTRPGGTLRV